MNLMLRKHLVATGAVVGHPACIEAGAVVKIKRFNSQLGAWVTIATADASVDLGTYRARIPDVTGKYRVKVATYPAGFVLCASGRSTTERHIH